jgi:hypothetical protein
LRIHVIKFSRQDTSEPRGTQEYCNRGLEFGCFDRCFKGFFDLKDRILIPTLK